VDVRSLDWGSRESQSTRFRVLSEVRGLRDAPQPTVLDVGCGLGDFLFYLRDTGVKATYTGIDLVAAMIESAKGRFPDAELACANLLADDVLPGRRFDFVVASGIFVFRRHEPQQYLVEMVSRMFERCTRAVAFNTLSAWGPAQEDGEFYASPAATLEACRTLSRSAVLRHDYHPQDFTIYLYR
jgi:cyclopropane fatty-acyl-phospholipid synthase-like methyltransferase